jgi:hypothetical protein
VGNVFEYAWHWYGTVGTEPLALNIAALIQTLLCLSGIALTWIDGIPWVSRLIRRAVGRRAEETVVPDNEVYWRSLLVVVYIVFVLSLILSGNSPLTQSSYFWGMVGVQIVIVACTLVRICRILPRFVGIGLLISLVRWIGVIQVTDFAQMVEFHRLSGHVYSYRDAKRAVDWIAADWWAKNRTSRLTLRINYDMLPQAPDWWIAAFHAVDPAYHIGMTFNALLRSQNHIANSNTSADGRVEQHDYTVVYRSGLWRYIGAKGTRHEFGQFVVIAR